MRAYAIVRKPQPALHDHVVRVAKQEPKIIISPITENRLVSPHKAQANDLHELSSSGAYLRFTQKQQPIQHHSQADNASKHGSEIRNNSRFEEFSVHSNHENPPNEQRQQSDKMSKVGQQLPREEHPHYRHRTKRLFQEFQASPPKNKEEEQLSQWQRKQQKLNATPVRMLEPDPEPEPPLLKTPPQGAQNHTQSIVMQYNQPRGEVVYESDSKNSNCCGQVVAETHPEPPPQMVFTHPSVGQAQTQEKHDSNKKKRIFKEFEEKDHVVEEITFKDPKISNRNIPLVDSLPTERTLKIKVFEFATILPFDI